MYITAQGPTRQRANCHRGGRAPRADRRMGPVDPTRMYPQAACKRRARSGGDGSGAHVTIRRDYAAISAYVWVSVPQHVRGRTRGGCASRAGAPESFYMY